VVQYFFEKIVSERLKESVSLVVYFYFFSPFEKLDCLQIYFMQFYSSSGVGFLAEDKGLSIDSSECIDDLLLGEI
jgi:hypothetical protein